MVRHIKACDSGLPTDQNFDPQPNVFVICDKTGNLKLNLTWL